MLLLFLSGVDSCPANLAVVAKAAATEKWSRVTRAVPAMAFITGLVVHNIGFYFNLCMCVDMCVDVCMHMYVVKKKQPETE